MHTYAYITSENCVCQQAFAPGDYYQNQPVSRHGDLRPWRWGKRATLAMITTAETAYNRHAARLVAEVLGWH